MANDKLGWLACAAVAVVLVAAVAYWQWGPSVVVVRKESAAPQVDQVVPGLDVLRDKAAKLQAEGKWREAQDAWDRLLDESSAGSDETEYALRAEAERNQRIAEQHAHPESPPVDEWVLPEPPAAERPREVPAADVVEFYPVGRTVRSIAYLHVNGRGSNRAWVFRSDASFQYQYQMIVETKVKENRGTSVVFEQDFKVVDERRAVSDRKLEFHFPDSPILREVWEQLDETVLPIHPAFRVVKKLGQLAQALDPNGRRSLTSIDRFLRKRGVQIADDRLELVERIRDLTGQRLEIEYVSGLGVTYIKVLDERRLDPDLLDRVAHGSSVFMDYFLADGARHAAGETFTLSSRDVGGLFNFGDEVRATGTIDLKRSGRAKADNAPAVLSIVGGEIEFEAPEEGVDQRVRLEPIKGTLNFSEGSRLVTLAHASWNAETFWATTDHLLFGTTNTRDLAIETYYEAELVSADSEAAK
jgi:hypothetical protein